MRADDLTLASAVDRIYYGASCETCKEVRRIDLNRLLASHGQDFLVGDIRPLLRCAKCGDKNVIAVTLWQDSTMSARMMEKWK